MKKLFTLFLALSLFSTRLSAQESEGAKQVDADSVLFSTTFYYEINQGEWIEKYEYAKAAKFLEWAKANSSARFDIKGWADPSGAEEFNAHLSFKRARTIRNYLVQRGIDSSRITFEGKGEDFETDAIKARRADVVAYYRVKKAVQPKQAEPIPEPAPAPATQQDSVETQEVAVVTQQEPEPVIEEVAAEVSEEKSKSCFDWNYFTPRTNLLYWLGGLMNIGVEYRTPESNFGFLLNGGYSPFGDTEWNHNLGGWFVAPEVRYYLPSNEQWFVGAQFLAAGYNIKPSYTGRQGTFIGGGVMGGYAINLSETFDMDFTLGLGYGHLEYDTYYHDDETETNPYIYKDGAKNSLIPIQVGVNLIWKIK